MKKFNLYFWLIALAAMITSCSQDETTGLQADESTLVTIGAAVNQGIQTRAASVTIPRGYKLRYVLEVWSTGADAACIYKYEKPVENAQAVEFTFNLTTAGDYKALLWADYVASTDNGTLVSATTDLNEYTHYTDVYYTTSSNLKNISLAKTSTNYVINDESRDAFFKCMDIKKGVGAFEESVELTRPFGQINVIERTTDLLAKVASMTLTYNVPQTFNVADGTVGTTVEVKPTVLALPTATTDRKANLFYDFVFAPTNGQTTLESIAMTFTSSDNSLQIEDFSIPANMPVERNKRTNITGSIIRTSAAPSNITKLSVTVSDSWSNDQIEKDVDPKVGDYYYKDGTWSTENKATAANPVIGVVYKVNADGGGKVVSHTEPTLAWTTDGNEATTGATSGPDGKANTEKIFAGVAAGTYSLDNYPIFKACKELRTSTGNDGWYILSIDQIDDLLYAVDDINDKITAISGGIAIVLPTSDFDGYWTSREAKNNNTIAWVSNGLRSGGTVTKTAEHRVRFVLDF